MKITIVTSPFCPLPPTAVGAIEKLFHSLAGEWARAGNRVSFVCCGGGDNPAIEYRRLKRYRRTGSTKKDIIWDFFYSVKAIWACTKTDILLCNTFWTPILAPLMRWKYRRLIYGVHRFPKGQFWLYPLVHKFICVSAAVSRALIEEVNERRVSVVVNPIDTAIFNDVGSTSVRRAGCIMYAGRVHPLKGLACLAKACARLTAEGLVDRLVLVGPYEIEKGGGGDEFVDELRRLAGDCPVELKGSIVDPRELAATERAAGIFVYPSEDAMGEACPVAPMEAMALGVPTVVSSLECFDEFVEDGVNALKFRLGDVDDLMEKMRSLLVDRLNARKLAAAGAETARQFSVAEVAGRYVSEFKGVLKWPM